MKIGIVGSGQIGMTLARKLVLCGHLVKLSNSRGPDTIADTAAVIGATAVTVVDAVSDVDTVIVSIPQGNIPALERDLFRDIPPRTVVVDTGNYYPGIRDRSLADIDAGMVESEWVAKTIGRPVVKAFNSIIANSLATKGRPAGSHYPSQVIVQSQLRS